MLKAISMDATREFVSTSDPAKHTPEKARAGEPNREATDATVFLIGTLSARVMGAIKDSATTFRPDPNSPDPANPTMIAEFHPSEAAYLMTQFGLRGVRRFQDDRGNEVPFETVGRQMAGLQHQVASPTFMDRLGLERIREIAEQVENQNTPEPVQLGN